MLCPPPNNKFNAPVSSLLPVFLKVEEYAPIAHTPTVGLVYQSYSGLFRRPRGMHFSAADHGEMMSLSYQVVAVKQLNLEGHQGNQEFILEVLMLSLLHHPDLVNLIGYRMDGDEMLLV